MCISKNEGRKYRSEPPMARKRELLFVNMKVSPPKVGKKFRRGDSF
jgi:hypothetical protein